MSTVVFILNFNGGIVNSAYTIFIHGLFLDALPWQISYQLPLLLRSKLKV